MSKKKRIIIVTGFCLLLALTGVLNIVLNNSAKTSTAGEVTTTANFFTSYRTDRNSTYDQEMSYLNAIIASSSASAEAKANAEAEQAKIIANMKLQNQMEGLIKAKGFTDVVVSALTNNISVIVKSGSLTDVEVANIVDVITSETDYTIDNIKIIPVE